VKPRGRLFNGVRVRQWFRFFARDGEQLAAAWAADWKKV
jgi:hypothetical protein